MTRRSVSSNGSALALCLFSVVLVSCTPSRVILPEGPGVPYADYHELFDRAVAACRGVRTLEALLALRGQTGEANLRGRVRTAVAEPASLRLEGLTPFGGPAFVLVVGEQPAILLLPRERRVVADAAGRDLLEALAGVELGPAEVECPALKHSIDLLGHRGDFGDIRRP